jgi:hypothetical protein
MVAYGLFFNLRLYENDKRTMRESLLNALATRQTAFEEEMRKVLAKSSEAVDLAARAAANEAVAHTSRVLKQRLDELAGELKLVSVANLEREAEDCMVKGVPTNALRSYLTALRSQVELGFSPNVADTLGKMIEAARKCTFMYADQLSELTTALAGVPDAHATLRERLREAQNKIQVVTMGS